jgi:hypothetical protein
MENYVLNSFFPLEKGEFDYNDFENNCLGKGLEGCIERGVFSAFYKVKNSELELQFSTRASALHDQAFRDIENEINTHIEQADVFFTDGISGNQRMYFGFNNYLFILAKDGSSTNDTSVTESIRNQYGDRHIMIIKYSIDQLWENVLSIDMQYSIGNSVIYNNNIFFKGQTISAHYTNDDNEITATKPMLRESSIEGEK